MEFNYVSLVGTQVMAVLNPILALKKSDFNVVRILLFHTDHTIDKSIKIKQYLKEKLSFNENDIIIKELKRDMMNDVHANESLKALLKDIVVKGSIIFNLAGGMNYQIVSFINAMKDFEQMGFLYPEIDKVHVFIMKNGVIEDQFSSVFPDNIDIEDILKLQGVPYKISASRSTSSLLERALKLSKLTLPTPGIKNISIGDVDFDYVWNYYNTLHYIASIEDSVPHVRKSVESDKKTKSEKNAYDAKEDAIMRLARGRAEFGELYHRGFTLLTYNKKTYTKMNEMGGGKISAIYLPTIVSEDKIKTELSAIFDRPARPIKRGGGGIKETLKIRDDGDEANNALVVVLGRDIMPSMIALWSHQPKHAYFLYTNDDAQVDLCRKSLIQYKNFLPCDKMTFIPIEMLGDDILKLKTNEGQSVAVNITPGTKSQSTFLAVWAELNSAKIHSLMTNTQQLYELPHSVIGALNGPSPALMLDMNGYELIKRDLKSEAKLKSEAHYKIIYEFLKRMDQENISIKKFMNERINLQRSKSSLIKLNENEVEFMLDGKRSIVNIQDGQWFEDFVGYIFMICGAQNVNTRVRIAWNEHMARNFNAKYHKESHMVDIDVAARIDSNYYVVSCKAGAKGNVNKEHAKLEVEHTAALFGRFTIPMMCFLKSAGEPYKNGDVYVFGYKTLIDTDKFKNLIKKATNERRKTT